MYAYQAKPSYSTTILSIAMLNCHIEISINRFTTALLLKKIFNALLSIIFKDDNVMTLTNPRVKKVNNLLSAWFLNYCL